MTSHSRTFPWLVAVVLTTVGGSNPAPGQDTPLYRDPSPTEGARLDGPLLSPLPPRPSSTPPPPSSLGPFQTGPSATVPAAEPIREPLLIVQPIPPPLPPVPFSAMASFGDVQIKRKTTIRPPNGPFGRCHVWIREALFGPPKPPVETTYNGSKPGFFNFSRPFSSEGTVPPSRFQWPVWPLSNDR